MGLHINESGAIVEGCQEDAMAKGRVEKLWAWTSQETGYTLHVRKVSTLLRAEIRRQVIASPGFEEPQPPTVEVDYGDGKVVTPHRGHPVYQQLLLDWQNRVNNEAGERLKAIALDRGVVVESGDIDMDAVIAMRLIADLKAYDDRHVFVAFVAIGSEEDWRDLLKTIFERSAPSEAAIQSHIATFPPDVSGAGSVSPVA